MTVFYTLTFAWLLTIGKMRHQLAFEVGKTHHDLPLARLVGKMLTGTCKSRKSRTNLILPMAPAMVGWVLVFQC